VQPTRGFAKRNDADEETQCENGDKAESTSSSSSSSSSSSDGSTSSSDVAPCLDTDAVAASSLIANIDASSQHSNIIASGQKAKLRKKKPQAAKSVLRKPLSGKTKIKAAWANVAPCSSVCVTPIVPNQTSNENAPSRNTRFVGLLKGVGGATPVQIDLDVD